MKHIVAFLILATLSISGAMAQFFVSIEPVKKSFLCGEPMSMKLTVTNNSGKAVTFKSTNYSSWLDIQVKYTNGNAHLPEARFAVFPQVNIPAGQSISRTVDLRHFYDLSREGNYHVQAVIKMQNHRDMFASGHQLFSVRSGAPLWSQTTGIAGSAKRCKYSLCTITNRGEQELYVQTKDPDTGVAYNAVHVGNWLGTRRPQTFVDGKSNVHVFFPTTPTLYAYARVNFRGMMEKLQYYKRHVGIPSMVFLPDGSVRVTGAEHYDPTKPQKTERDVTDIPPLHKSEKSE